VKVFEVCGQPTLRGMRSRRKASAGLSSEYNWHESIQRAPAPSPSEGIESLIHDIHEHLLTTHNFWKNLPDSMCSQLAAAPFELTNCWNGLSVSRFSILFGHAYH